MKIAMLRPFVVVLLAIAVFCQGTWALAGTTGGLSGIVTSANGAPVAEASVTATSPSGTFSTTTDATGHFRFLSLSPDSYTVSVDKTGFAPASLAGIAVFADNTQTVSLRVTTIKEIGSVVSRSSGNLVKSGTTADVYSVNAATGAAAAALGGGGNLNTAYSAIASTPGVYVPGDQQGWGQFVYIRGGKYDQVGFEYDGVPVNRAFDNYAASTLSNNGQQELQVYTGGSPASASAGTVSGFINQVIKTGTNPGFGQIQLGLGTNIFYHQMHAEAGGATPNRLFSYYAGFTGYNQGYRYFSQSNGSDLPDIVSTLGTFPASNSTLNINTNFPGNATGLPLGNCITDATAGYYVSPFSASAGSQGATPLPGGMHTDPGCYLNNSPGAGNVDNLSDREFVTNLHFGIPHKHDAGKDDVQLLYDLAGLHVQASDSLNDYYGSAANYNKAIGYFNSIVPAFLTAPYNWQDGYIFPAGTVFGQSATGLAAQQYFFPSSPQNRAFKGIQPSDTRGGQGNDSAIVKLQYQKNIGSNAYARLFGYTFYSDWLMNSPNANHRNIAFPGNSQFATDYELINHTKGLEFQLADQLNAQNLLTLTANYSTSASLRFSNSTQRNSKGTTATSFTDGNTCYAVKAGYDNNSDASGNPTFYNVGDPAPCYQVAASNGLPSVVTYGTFGNPSPAGAPAVPGASFRVSNAAETGTISRVTPKFTSISLQDEFRPSEKLNLNVGLRYDRFEYDLGNTSYNGQDFWTAAAAREFCYDPKTLVPISHPVPPGVPPDSTLVDTLGACPTIGGVVTVHPDGLMDPNPAIGRHVLLTNKYNPTLVRSVFSPRVGLTYTLGPNTVVRASFTKSAQPSNVAYVQYDNKNGKAAGTLLFPNFFQFGFASPRHDLDPEIGTTGDFSLERRIAGTDTSFKLTPYYRSTSQVQDFPTNAGIKSGLNTGHEIAYGLEAQIQKGDFARNGVAGLLSYTYTRSKVRYTNFPNSTVNFIDQFNSNIDNYNALADPAKGAAPCYENGTPNASCSDPANPTAVIRNPYYGMAAQAHLDRNAYFSPIDQVTPIGNFGIFAQTYDVPHVLSGVVQYKHDRFAFSPSFTLNSGNRYGAPNTLAGIDPRTCGSNQTGSPSLTGSAVQKPDYTSCGPALTTSNLLFVPNPDTGRFDNIGQYLNPWQFQLSAQMSYEVSNKVKLNLILANLYRNCFGGSSTSWSAATPPSRNNCAYGNGSFVSNFYNGTSPTDVAANGFAAAKAYQHPYAPTGNFNQIGQINYPQPFNAYLEISFKL
ncbi:MAG: TonB-dependent receptor [Candidatus Eremiobacteraeota bacterium]|nr:TonB-dependent receptor [Candidatus Eremiobacteraeota bacterium]